MRLLFAAHQFFPEHYAGVETVTLSLAQEFKARGHEPYVLAPKRSIPATISSQEKSKTTSSGAYRCAGSAAPKRVFHAPTAWITRMRSWRIGPASTCAR